MRRFEMRDVIHFSVDSNGASAWVGGKSFHHTPRMRYIRLGGAEASVNHRHLIGVDGDAAGEAVAPGNSAISGEAVEIAEIGIERVDRRDAC